MPGQRFGRYVIESVAGAGGMGCVYRCRDVTLGRLVALKTLTIAGGEEALARFLREARLAASLEHPRIVAVYELGAIDGVPFVAMEWLDGQPLGRFLGARVTTPDERFTLLLTVAEILAFAHRRGVVHRDLKPSNVMVDAQGRPTLIDFGLAKRVASERQAGTLVTQDDVVLGTPSYMAPEQMLSSSVDARADQFSWAVMFYETLAGVHPRAMVTGGDPFPLGRPRELAELQPRVSPQRAAIIMRAMSVHREDRYATMDDLLDDWRRAQSAVGDERALVEATLDERRDDRTLVEAPRDEPNDGSPTARRGAIPTTRRRSRAFVFAIALTVTLAVASLALLTIAKLARTPRHETHTLAPPSATVADEDASEELPDAGSDETLVTDAAPDAPVVVDAGPPRVRRAYINNPSYLAHKSRVVEARATYLTLAKATTPCFAGGLKRNASVSVLVDLSPNGHVDRASVSATCSGRCEDLPWVPDVTLQCVTRVLEGTSFPPLDDELTEGAQIGFFILPPS